MINTACVIVTGNPVDGLSFIGPFPDSEEATQYCEVNIDSSDWWIAPLEHPTAVVEANGLPQD